MAVPRTHKLLPILTGLFVATLLVSNTIEPKVFSLFGIELTAGTIVFPLAYIFGDLLTEVYGYAASRRVIWTGFACLVFMAASYALACALPAASYWNNQQAFKSVFGQVPRIVLASIIAYACGEFMNAYVLAKMKIAQAGRRMGTRFIASTFAGQALDTGVFMTIAFAGVLPPESWLNVTLTCWAVKVAWEIVALPVTLPLVRAVKRYENEDSFDFKTNFNPFALSEPQAAQE